MPSFNLKNVVASKNGCQANNINETIYLWGKEAEGSCPRVASEVDAADEVDAVTIYHIKLRVTMRESHNFARLSPN